MSVPLLMEYVVIALAVLCSAGYVMHKQWPEVLRVVRIHCAVPLLRDGRASWLRSIGHAIAPMPRTGQSACGGCNTCGTNE